MFREFPMKSVLESFTSKKTFDDIKKKPEFFARVKEIQDQPCPSKLSE